MHFKFFNKLFLFENDEEVHCFGTGVSAINDSKLVMTKVGKYKLAQGSLIHTGNNWARLGAPGPQSSDWVNYPAPMGPQAGGTS